MYYFKQEEIEPFPEERENFLQQLYKFMEDRGRHFNLRLVEAEDKALLSNISEELSL